ncbi:MAG: N-acetyltransferase [Phoenicibacter congonensis]|uniref:N-acetyltransferase n=1 Tax=Phoenicibacter congonensis TaxID=1944646 RepID=A0AA43RJK0_9ACTN|nr:N-acetyltransferase [Phoenicibacter congonensis]
MELREIRDFREEDLPEMVEIWNEVVEDGVAFPQEECLDVDSAREFFSAQDGCRVAVLGSGEVAALSIIHPNAIGRSGHIANASYAVSSKFRGLHIGDKIVRDSLEVAKSLGYRILQFNAVVASNVHALHLYERIGFKKIGCIEGGFRNKQGEYEDMFAYFYPLV